MTGTLDIRKLAASAAYTAGRLMKALEPLQRILFFSPADQSVFPRRNIAAVMERGRLSIALGTTFLSRVTIQGVREYTYDEGAAFPEPQEVAASLVLALNEFGGSGQGITLGIPKSWAVVATAEFPSTVKENLADVAAYELDRVTPFSADDAYFDFRVLKESGDRITLLIVAARADAVRPYIRALEENGLTVDRVAVNLSGLGTLCLHMEKTGDCIAMQVTATDYEGGLFLDGTLTEASSGRFAARDEASMAKDVLATLQALAASAKAQGKKPACSVLLTDAPASLGELLKVQAGLPLKVLDTGFTGIRFSAPPQRTAYVAAGVLLEGLLPGTRGVNLLRKGVARVAKVPVFLTVALLCCLAGLGILYMITPLRVEELRLKEVTRQVALRKDEVRKVEALKKENEALAAELGVIDAFKKDRLMTIAIVRELTTLLPKTAWLTRTRVTETAVELEGYASSATELLPKLESSTYFRKVEFASPTFRDARMNSDRFVIKMEIEGAVKQEEKPKHEKK